MIAVARKGKSQDRASGTVHPQSSRLSLDRHISNESSHDNEMQETSRARKRKNQNRASDITHPQSSRPSLDQRDDLIEPSHDNEMEDMPLETEPSNGEGSTIGIKKGRGKAKGKDGNGTPILIRRGRIITTGAVRTIGVLFYQAIDGAWPTFRTFPSTQMDLLYDRFNATGYTHTCSEEEMREAFEQHIKLRHSDWMSALRNSVFKKYKTTGDRYTHCPLGISQDVWSKLVDHWLQPTWQDKSKRNKSNRSKSTIVHTTGSVPMEKYRKDELDRTGIEPSPIDCFKKFHVSKPKNGGEESWPSEKAKELFEKMENKKVAATEDENEVDDWDIYKEVIGGPSHGRILGLGGGYSTKDVYPSDDQDCNKRICLEREEEHEKLKEEVKDLKSVLYELKDLVQSMRENNSNTYARSRQSAPMDNVESCSDAHLEDE
ncbi:PREDICTED: LOC107623553 isoform [Prunus dulcis]|uniref:PREDICTED: LOC107623553 isoform n=1 Tax=Prunus dulcis TaxID=3755 RepID=A0A5E4FZ40_PRUDU|nr:PREDICTED: LOC107623553 isoform [Prunus dulcis]VVA32674.1 PREDICTED: LOC107623553 isoform [Prunus dulcis]